MILVLYDMEQRLCGNQQVDFFEVSIPVFSVRAAQAAEEDECEFGDVQY